MKRIKAKIKAKITKHISNHQFKAKLLNPSVFFVSIALALALGYSAGVYHYNVESAIGPVFGVKSHDASIDMSSLQETYNKLAANYDGTLNKNDLIQGANRGMVAAAGDAYTTYFSPSEATDFNNSLSGNIGGGIGAEIGLKNDQLTINRPLADNPAIKAGLLAGDIILKVNDESTTGWTVDQAVGVIRGDAGTTVKLTIQRGTDTKDYTVTRAIINNPSVYSTIVNELGTITISRFDGETGALAKAAAQDFVKKGVKSVILDLRYNGGGYVSAAVDVAGLWLDNQVIVTERTGTNGATIKDTLKSGSDAILKGIPTVVLVNGESASASEIVAGALQDNKAAKLVGEKTYGKGSVQEPLQLSGGAELKVTVARWYTPNGKNITKEGITPDVTATLTQTDINNSVDPQVDAAKKALGL